MSLGVKLGSKIAALDHDVYLDTVKGKSLALAYADMYRKIVHRECMPVDIRVRKAYNKGHYSVYAVPTHRGSKK